MGGMGGMGNLGTGTRGSMIMSMSMSLRSEFDSEDVDAEIRSLSLSMSATRIIGESPLGNGCERDYDVLGVLGAGGMARVYLVQHVDSRGLCSAKVLRKEHVVQSGQVENVRRELEILSALDSDWCVEYLGGFQNRANLYVLVSFVQGGDFRSLLEYVGRLDVEQAAFYGAELACALQDLHETGILYCDLKPSNILVEPSGHIKLCDFGFSVFESDLDELGACVQGTPEYMAPEVYQKGSVSRASDWWALGMVVGEMVLGEPLWGRRTREQVFAALETGNLSFPFDDIPEPAREFVASLVVSDVESRVGAAGDMHRLSFFKGVSWSSIRSTTAPFSLSVASLDDLAHFDDRLCLDLLDWSDTVFLASGEEDISGQDPYVGVFEL